MKKATVFNKVLSVLLVVSLVLSLAIPGLAAQTDVSFKQVSNSSVSAKLPGREAVDVAGDEVPDAATEIVRVSIVLEQGGTLDAGSAATLEKSRIRSHPRSRTLSMPIWMLSGI